MTANEIADALARHADAKNGHDVDAILPDLRLEVTDHATNGTTAFISWRARATAHRRIGGRGTVTTDTRRRSNAEQN
jgi:hypothetical protein